MNVDKSVLITGCSSGIGLRCAQLFKRDGFKVFATARNEHDVAMLKQQGFEHALQLDVCNYKQMREVLDYVAEHNQKKIGIVFNNAGYSQIGVAEDLSLAALKEQFETNFFAICELTRQVLPLMHAQNSGRIIMNSSIFGLSAGPFRAAYCASKYALEAYSDCLRMELSMLKSGIKVVLIEPGPVVSKVRENKKRYFEKHIDVENSVYKKYYEKISKGLALSGKIPFTVEPDAVYEKIRQCIYVPNPKPRYYVTILTYAVGYMKRVLNTRLMDLFTLNVIVKKEVGDHH